MKRIAVVPNNNKDLGLLHTKRVVECLMDRTLVYMDKIYATDGLNINYTESDNLFDNVDFAVVLGGDGTILKTALPCAEKNVPVLGVNLGRVGFMSEVEPEELEIEFDKILRDDYLLEKRMMIKISVKKDCGEKMEIHALNDVVVSKTDGCKLIGMELFTDGELMNKYVADGLIISTPTGSTGYSISAGGPVVDPSMSLFLATPICAHMLSARSAVLSAEKKLNIKLDQTYAGSRAVIMADGSLHGYIKSGDEVTVTKSKYHMDLIRVNKKSFYDTLISKLS